MDAARLRPVLERWFPGEDLAITRAGAGVSTPVYRVLASGETFWVRLGEQPGECRDGEIAAHRILVAAGLPVPTILRYDAMPPELDRSIALTSHIPGVPLATVTPGPWLPSLAVEVGAVLARINHTPVRGFGWANGAADDRVPVGEHASRATWVEEYRQAFLTVRDHQILDPVATTRLEAMIERWCSAPDTSTGCLAHGDLDTSHIYLDPSSGLFTGIIDFGEVRGADPLYDLGHLLLHDGEAGRPEIFPLVLRGYREVLPRGDVDEDQVLVQALAIGTRALALQLRRPPSPYRDWLRMRLVSLLSTTATGGDSSA